MDTFVSIYYCSFSWKKKIRENNNISVQKYKLFGVHLQNGKLAELKDELSTVLQNFLTLNTQY